MESGCTDPGCHDITESSKEYILEDSTALRNNIFGLRDGSIGV